jgi:hypothetical protein
MARARTAAPMAHVTGPAKRSQRRHPPHAPRRGSRHGASDRVRPRCRDPQLVITVVEWRTPRCASPWPQTVVKLQRYAATSYEHSEAILWMFL